MPSIYNVRDGTLKRRTEHTKIIFDNICYCKRKYQTEYIPSYFKMTGSWKVSRRYRFLRQITIWVTMLSYFIHDLLDNVLVFFSKKLNFLFVDAYSVRDNNFFKVLLKTCYCTKPQIATAAEIIIIFIGMTLDLYIKEIMIGITSTGITYQLGDIYFICGRCWNDLTLDFYVLICEQMLF